jgi:diaminopropionate ammonia-lyase
MREASGLNAQSRVLVINTEGASDPGLYAQVVGTAAWTSQKGEIGEKQN